MTTFPRGLLRRPRQLAVADRERLSSLPARGKLTVLVGPSGTGKSVVAGQIADAVGHSTSLWCRLAPGWNQAFDIVSMAYAAARADPPAFGEDIIEAAEALLGLLEAEPTTLVIDDVHECEGSDAERLLAEIAAFMPSEAAVVVTTRRRPTELIGLVDPALINIVDADDLRFTKTEAEVLLAARAVLPEQRSAIVAASGGLALALVTGADAGSGAESAHAALAAVFSPDHLGRLFPLAQAAAVLPYLTPDLSKSLSLGDVADLRSLAHHTSLLTEAGDSWRLHSSAKAYLAAGLAPEQVARLQATAAQALRDDDAVTAIGLFVEAGEAEAAGDLLAARASEVGPTRATRWLYQLPADVRTRLPPILTSGRATVNVSLAIIAAHQQVDLAPTPRDRAEHLLGLGSLLLADGDLSEAAASFEAGLKTTSDMSLTALLQEHLGLTRWYAGDVAGAEAALGDDTSRPWAAWLRAQISLAAGSIEDAAYWGRQAAAFADGSDATRAAGEAAVAAAQLISGELGAAKARAASAYKAALEVGGRDLAVSAPVYVWTLIHHGEIDEAETVCAQLQRSVGRHDHATKLSIALAKRTLSRLAGASTEDIDRSDRRVRDLRIKGFAPLESLAGLMAPSNLHHQEGLSLVVRLLGQFEATCDGSLLTSAAWKSRKAQEVCAYMAQAGSTGARREQIIEAVWPGREPEKGRTLLRTALSEIRRVLEPQRVPGAPSKFVIVDGEHVVLHGAATDVREAETSMRDGDFATAFTKLAQGMAPGVPESEWVAGLGLVVGRLIVETASRLITTDHTNEIVEAAYEALITAEPWDRRHFDGLMSHHREAGDEAAALDVERRWFADDS